MADKPVADSDVLHTSGDEIPELKLTREDVLDAMRHIPGYLDISVEDFQQIYHLSHRHALERLFSKVRAGTLMRTEIEPLRPEMTLENAAAAMAQQGLSRMPVVNESNRVIGMLTETDFLRRLKANTFLELLQRLVSDISSFNHRCHDTTVNQAMIVSPVCVEENAGFFQIIRAFRHHQGRSMPVTNQDGEFRGLLFRKDFIKVFHLEELL